MAADRTSALHIRLVCCTKWTLLAPAMGPAAARRAQFPLQTQFGKGTCLSNHSRLGSEGDNVWMGLSLLSVQPRTSVSEFPPSLPPPKVQKKKKEKRGRRRSVFKLSWCTIYKHMQQERCTNINTQVGQRCMRLPST